MATALRISALDGYALGARHYGEQGSGPLVVIAGATAVKQAYYARFAAWLSLRGCTVLTFDYRGVGESRPAKLVGFEASLKDWGEKDLEAVLRFATAERGGRSLHLIGHSVGGQLLGLAPSAAEVERIVTVASQSGALRHWSGLSAVHKAAVWYGLIPTVGGLLGYVPGKLGLGEDLPGGVALEWARWCRHPDYFLGHGVSRTGYERVRAPIRSISLSDDDYAPAPAVDWLHQLYSNARVERVHLSPDEFDVPAIGHFGFFRSTFQDSLWPQVTSFLLGSPVRRVSTDVPVQPAAP